MVKQIIRIYISVINGVVAKEQKVLRRPTGIYIDINDRGRREDRRTDSQCKRSLFRDRTLRAFARAHSALDALFRIDNVRLFNRAAYCAYGAVARTDGAAYALRFVDFVADERFAHARGALAVTMRLVLVAEITERRQHGVRRGLTQAAQRVVLYVMAQLF